MGDLIQALPQALEHRVLERPEGAFQVGLRRDGVADGARLHPAEFQQPEDIRGQSLLCGGGPAVEFRAGGQGVDALFGFGNVGGSADKVHIDLAGPAHQLVFPAEYLAGFQTRPQVQAEDGFHIESGKHAGLTQVFGAAGAFFAGLEDQKYILG